jgi:hypothetical protein
LVEGLQQELQAARAAAEEAAGEVAVAEARSRELESSAEQQVRVEQA